MPGDHERNNEIFSELELVLLSLLGDAHISFTPLVNNLIFRLFMLVKSISNDGKITRPFNRAQPVVSLSLMLSVVTKYFILILLSTLRQSIERQVLLVLDKMI